MKTGKRSIWGDQPFFYYGWVIVFSMASAGAVSMAMGSLNFGLFIKPMGDELGVGRAFFGWAQTARQVSSSVTSPTVGWLLDRFGSRILLPVAAVITGGAMIALAFINSSWQLVALFAVMGLVGMSGPGALVTSVPILKWFVRRRGAAVAFVGLGIPVGAMIFVPLTQYFIDAWGWRTAWIVLAILGISIIVPLSLIFVRRRPEDMNLLPDGLPSKPGPDVGADTSGEPLGELEISWTARNAMRTLPFWSLVVGFSMVALAIGTVAVHRIAAFMDRGLDPTLVSIATAFDAVCAGVATFAFGMLVRWVSVRILGAIGFCLLGLASVMTIYADYTSLMFVSMAVFGLGIGGMMFLQNFVWADYFGREYVGSIRGVVAPITLTVGGIGPPLAGYVRDWTGSYNPVWWGGVCLMFLAALVILATTAPKNMPDEAGAT